MTNAISFDIETVAKLEFYHDLPDKELELWQNRCQIRYKHYLGDCDSEFTQTFYQCCWEREASKVALFSRILCISISVYGGAEKSSSYTKSFTDEDERKLLIKFLKTIKELMDNGYHYITGYNIKSFDIPFVLKRSIINGIPYSKMPKVFQIRDAKPWDLKFILDMKDWWCMGSYMLAETLDECCTSLGIDSPKDKISGADIYEYHYKRKCDISEISEYCEKDAYSCIQIMINLMS